MELGELDDLIYGLGIEPTPLQLNQLLQQFQKDFVLNPMILDGMQVKVILQNAKVEDYTQCPETFVHLITRKSKGGKRVFDRHRANKIHWIRVILENREEEEVLYFQYREASGNIRDYYWYEEGDFLVIMEKITPDILIITSFFIHDERNRKYYRKKYEARVNR